MKIYNRDLTSFESDDMSGWLPTFEDRTVKQETVMTPDGQSKFVSTIFLFIDHNFSCLLYTSPSPRD